MRKDQCLFCGSRRCTHRIVTPDLSFDEIACQRHGDNLALHADVKLGGALRCTLQSSAVVRRGDPYPVDVPVVKVDSQALAMLAKVLREYSGHWHYGMGGETGYKCDFCGVYIDHRSNFDAVVEHEPDCTLMAAWALVHRLKKVEVSA